MKRKLTMVLTMISLVCLSAFMPPGKATKARESNVSPGRPAVKIYYQTEFAKQLLDKLDKKNLSTITQSRQPGPITQYWWWDFNGNYIQQWDPGSYSLDPDNWPECTTVSGSIYCEIRAPMAWDSEEPVLTDIQGSRFRPLP